VPKRWRYQLFDLRVASAFKLSLPEADDGFIDVVITRSAEAVETAGEDATMSVDDEGARFSWRGVGVFQVLGVDLIEVTPAVGGDEELIQFPLLGPVFGYLLQARGNLVLHASGVEVEGGGVLFLGDKGDGKSTLASAMIAAGHTLVTDDVAALAFRNSELIVAPGLPSLKLSREVGATLNGALGVPRQLHPFIPKMIVDAPRVAVAPTRLLMALTLRRGETMRLKTLSADQAFLRIVRYSYVTRFLSMPKAMAAAHFRLCALAANRALIAELTMRPGLDRLGEAVHLLEETRRTYASTLP
jgi:hypothetical protein